MDERTEDQKMRDELKRVEEKERAEYDLKAKKADARRRIAAKCRAYVSLRGAFADGLVLKLAHTDIFDDMENNGLKLIPFRMPYKDELIGIAVIMEGPEETTKTISRVEVH